MNRLLILLFFASSLLAHLSTSEEQTKILRTAQEVRNLDYDSAKAGPVVELEVVVISHLYTGFDAQDESGGLFFKFGRLPTLGHKVRIKGKVTGGLYEPYIIVDSLEDLGKAKLPEPLQWQTEYFYSGIADNRLIEVEGILLQSNIQANNHKYGTGLLVTKNQEIAIRYHNKQHPFDREYMLSLKGARVRLRGSGAPLFNNSKQRIGSDLYCSSDNFIEVLSPSNEQNKIPLTPVGEIRSWNHRQNMAGLIRTSGVVTFIDQDHKRLVIQQGEQAAPVWLHEPTELEIGESIEINGFPYSYGYFVGIQRATLMTRNLPISSNSISKQVETDPFTKANPFKIIQVTGTVSRTSDEYINLSLDNGKQIIVHGPKKLITSLPKEGSKVALSGIKWIEANQHGKLVQIALELRNQSDITIISTPSWWTPKRYLAAIATLAILICGAIGWSLSLSREVKSQTAEIQNQIEENATLEERNRISRELHDTLSQGFSGLAYQLHSINRDMIKNPAKAQQKLQLATRMAEHSLKEVRHSLSNLRSPLLKNATLWNVICEQGAKICEAAGFTFNIIEPSSTTATTPQDSLTDHELFRIVIEAISNAIKHSEGSEITIHRKDNQWIIHDDGNTSFDPILAINSVDHFGLRGMHERAKKIHAELTIESSTKEGTTVTITLPNQSQYE